MGALLLLSVNLAHLIDRTYSIAQRDSSIFTSFRNENRNFWKTKKFPGNETKAQPYYISPKNGHCFEWSQQLKLMFSAKDHRPESITYPWGHFNSGKLLHMIYYLYIYITTANASHYLDSKKQHRFGGALP